MEHCGGSVEPSQLDLGAASLASRMWTKELESPWLTHGSKGGSRNMSKGASETQNFRVTKAQNMLPELNKDIDLVSTTDRHPAASLLNIAIKMAPIWALPKLQLELNFFTVKLHQIPSNCQKYLFTSIKHTAASEWSAFYSPVTIMHLTRATRCSISKSIFNTLFQYLATPEHPVSPPESITCILCNSALKCFLNDLLNCSRGNESKDKLSVLQTHHVPPSKQNPKNTNASGWENNHSPPKVKWRLPLVSTGPGFFKITGRLTKNTWRGRMLPSILSGYQHWRSADLCSLFTSTRYNF